MKVSKPIQTQGKISESPKWGPSMAVGDSQKFKRGHKGLERTLHRKQFPALSPGSQSRALLPKKELKGD